jgi:DNA mismatch endonuclease (patch repair protein)
MPATRSDYWAAKFERNAARDRRVIDDLKGAGWRVLVIWECETKDEARLTEILKRLLQGIVIESR